VLDLDSGAGFACFLAAPKVGPLGRVIGVDMTPEMMQKTRAKIQKSGAQNVESRLGEIEHLPLVDAAVDVVISNCAINLAPDKNAVFRDAFRVLRPGGRMCISDIVATEGLPAARFDAVEIDVNEQSRKFVADWASDRNIERYIASATIRAVKR